MAFAASLHKQYYGTKAGFVFSRAFELPGKKGLASAKVKGSWFHDFEEALKEITTAHFLCAWLKATSASSIRDLCSNNSLYPSNFSRLMKRVSFKTALCYSRLPWSESSRSVNEGHAWVAPVGPQGTVAAASASHSSRRKLSERSLYSGINNVDSTPDEGFGDNIHGPDGSLIGAWILVSAFNCLTDSHSLPHTPWPSPVDYLAGLPNSSCDAGVKFQPLVNSPVARDVDYPGHICFITSELPCWR